MDERRGEKKIWTEGVGVMSWLNASAEIAQRSRFECCAATPNIRSKTTSHPSFRFYIFIFTIKCVFAYWVMRWSSQALMSDFVDTSSMVREDVSWRGSAAARFEPSEGSHEPVWTAASVCFVQVSRSPSHSPFGFSVKIRWRK